MSRQLDPTQPNAIAPTWSAASATARGSSHVRSGLPNQDAALVRDVPEVGAVVAAVADGHGGARYVRSDVGAAFAVTIACELGARFALERSNDRDRSIQRRAAMELVPQLVDRWVAAVRDHVAQHPFLDEERARAGVGLDDEITYAYGATLLFVIATPGWVLIGQLGDGDVVVVDADVVPSRPVPRDNRLVAGQTTSLCLPDAPRDVRLIVLPTANVETIVLASDGYGNSFAGADWWQAVGRDVQSQLRTSGLAPVAASLPDWAADSAEVGGDDVTIAILNRNAAPVAVDPARSPTMPVPVPVPAAPPAPVAREGRGRTRLVVAGAVLVVLAVVAGIVAFALASDGSDADDDVAPTSTSVGPVVSLPEGSTTAPAPLGDRAFLRITNPVDAESWTPTSPFTLTGSVGSSSTVTLATNGGDPVSVDVDDAGNWAYDAALVEGENVLQITVTDPRLDPRVEERKIHFDPTRPTVVVESPAPNSSHAGAVTISGRADPFSEIFVDGKKVATTGFTDEWSYSYTVTQNVTLHIAAHDRFGPGNTVDLPLRYQAPPTTTSKPPPSTTESQPPPSPPTAPTAPPDPTPTPPPADGGANPGGQAGPMLPPEVCARPDLPDDVRRTRCP